MSEIIKLAVVLTLICAVSASSLQFVRDNLEARIDMQSDLNVRGPALKNLFEKPSEKAEESAEEAEKAIRKLLANKIEYSKGDHKYPIFFSTKGADVTGLAIEAPGKGGYSDDIDVMIGVDVQTNKIIGMEIIDHSETPGVGSQVEKSTFRKQWKGLPVADGIKLKADGGTIDAISGATYSSKAVVNGTKQVLDLIKDNQKEIFDSIKSKMNEI